MKDDGGNLFAGDRFDRMTAIETPGEGGLCREKITEESFYSGFFFRRDFVSSSGRLCRQENEESDATSPLARWTLYG